MSTSAKVVVLRTPRGRSILLHPVSLFLFVWSLTVILYAMHLSRLLVFSTGQITRIASWILIPYLVAVVLYYWFCAVAPELPQRNMETMRLALSALDRALYRWFAVWIVITIVEIVVSGGLPMVWLFLGNSKTYFDFGIKSVHGLMNSLLLAIGLCEVGLFALDAKKSHLRIPSWIILWSVLVISRNMMIVFLIQSGIVLGMLRGINWRSVLKTVACLGILVLVFGYLGDLRSGAEAFRLLAQPSPEYPEWLPSGVLWAYIYVTTPIGNLMNTALTAVPLHSFLFPNTTSLLFPSVIRELIYSATRASDAVSGELVTDAFNVSTAYVGPVQDFGLLGIVCFSMFVGLIATYCWRKQTFRDTLIYAVVAQCLLLSVFFNHFFYLPVISQIPWLYLFSHHAKQTRKLGRNI